MSEPNARPTITTPAEAEASISAACAPLLAAGLMPTRVLMSVAMWKLLVNSPWSYSFQSGHIDRLVVPALRNPLAITVTSTNPDAPYAVVYAE